MEIEWKQTGLVPWLGMKLTKEQPFARDDKGRSYTPQGSGFEHIQRRVKELIGTTKYWTPGLAKRVEGWIVIDAPDVQDERTRWQQRRLVRGSALTYAQGGWPVLPLYDVLNSHTLIDACSCENSACKTPGQHPRVPLESASRDRETITGWFDAWPDCNLGLRLDTLAILEVVPEAGGRESLAALEAEHGTLRSYARQDTGKCATGRGWNYLFLAVDGIKTVRGFKPGLSLLSGPESVIMVSPSKDVNLNRYKWVKPWPEIEANTAPPLWLLDVVRGNK